MAFISATSWTDSANTGTQSVTVPGGAKLAVLGINGYSPTANYFSSGSVTIDGQAMTAVAADGSTSFAMTTLWYKITPNTGAVNVAWDWAGTAAGDVSAAFSLGFWDDAVTVAGDTYGAQEAHSPHATDTMTAVSGNLQIGAAGAGTGSAASWTWTIATKQTSVDGGSFNQSVSLADAYPTGNQSISASEALNNDGGIAAVVFTVSGGGGGPPANQFPSTLPQRNRRHVGRH